jgi:hypothetical protein
MSEKNHPNLITIVPENLNISHFIPGKIYKPSFTIYNTCNIPIILNLRSSDRNKLILSNNLIRLEVNQARKINLLIQDKINYTNGKIPSKKKLYISLNGEFVEEKFEINLIYFTHEIEPNIETESIIEGISNLGAEYLKYGQAKLKNNYNLNIKNIEKELINRKNDVSSSSKSHNINLSNNIVSIGNSQLDYNFDNNNFNSCINFHNNNSYSINVNNSLKNSFVEQKKNEQKNNNSNIIQKNCDFQIICNQSILEMLNNKTKTLLEKMQDMSNILQEFEKITEMNRNRYDSRYLLKSSMSVYSFGNNVFQKQFQERKKEIDKNYNSLEKICVLTENKLLLTEKEELTQRCKLLETKLKKLKNNKINDEKIKKGNINFYYNDNKENNNLQNNLNEDNFFSKRISSNITPLKSREISQLIEQTPIIPE